ncbi:hypothetical protein OnM2_060045 [Erysiphe neolycopersici]|uniref:Uncharacterized protein n=1 Tax=Erysiphe neolycopersici TaxID=212602 RepID=A0A420HPT8_9PEZI|nr:hypothetical protein OnM2_060045 [Erysiphe neolycopersici]
MGTEIPYKLFGLDTKHSYLLNITVISTLVLKLDGTRCDQTRAPASADPPNCVSKTTSMTSKANNGKLPLWTVNAVQASGRTIAENAPDEDVNPESLTTKTDTIMIEGDCPSLPKSPNPASSFDIFGDFLSNNSHLNIRNFDNINRWR